MRANATSFSPFSPTYENISNRLSRLKHTQTSESSLKQRPNSAKKVIIDIIPAQTRYNSPYQPRGRLSPSGIALLDHHLVQNEEKTVGRVGSNTGIRKYNQRQLRDVGEGRAMVQLKTQGSIGIDNILNSIGNSQTAWTPFQVSDTKKVRVVRQASKVRCDLIPGRIYSKAYLKTQPA